MPAVGIEKSSIISEIIQHSLTTEWRELQPWYWSIQHKLGKIKYCLITPVSWHWSGYTDFYLTAFQLLSSIFHCEACLPWVTNYPAGNKYVRAGEFINMARRSVLRYSNIASFQLEQLAMMSYQYQLSEILSLSYQLSSPSQCSQTAHISHPTSASSLIMILYATIMPISW